MRVLLDTHIALWAITDDPRLSAAARACITEPVNEIAVSAAVIWEIAIKHALGKEGMPIAAPEAYHWFLASGYRELAITAQHAVTVGSLPPIHTDPFDRILVAQALSEPMRLLTHDERIARYSDTVILV